MMQVEMQCIDLDTRNIKEINISVAAGKNERQNIATWREITELISDASSVFDCHLVVILGNMVIITE